MQSQFDWTVWLLAAAVVALFVAYFWFAGRTMIRMFLRLVSMIQNWPHARRAMVEAEVRAGGRYPWWYRALRVALVLAMIALLSYALWRKLA